MSQDTKTTNRTPIEGIWVDATQSMMPRTGDYVSVSAENIHQFAAALFAKFGQELCIAQNSYDDERLNGLIESARAQVFPAMQDVTAEFSADSRIVAEITVHNFEGTPHREVYDRTQTDDSIKDGDVLDLGNGNVAILMKAWPTVVFGEIEDFHRLASGVTFESIDDGKYAASAAKAREVVNNTPTAPDGRVHELFIKAAADCIAELRKSDVFRVISDVCDDNIDGVTRESLASWIKRERPDLVQEVDEVLADLRED